MRLFRVNTDPAWIAVVRREKYGAWESLDIRLLRDVSLIDYLDNRQQSMLDTLVVDVYRDRGATVFARVDRSRCLGGHYWIERDAHQTEEPLRGIVYWAIPPQILDPSVSYGFSDSLCDDIPLVRVIGIAGDSVIGSGLSHSPSGIPFYLLAAEVLVGSSGR